MGLQRMDEHLEKQRGVCSLNRSGTCPIYENRHKERELKNFPKFLQDLLYHRFALSKENSRTYLKINRNAILLC